MTGNKANRYVSFKGIQGDANAKRVMDHLLRYIDSEEHSNPFWERFKERLARAASGDNAHKTRTDELLLVHCYINNIRELFEQHDDQDALDLLQQVEEEAC